MILLVGFTSGEIEKIRDGVNEKIRPVGAMEIMEVVEKIILKDENLPYEKLNNERIVIMHDMENDKIRELILKIRKIIPEHIIFATTTPTSLKWRVKDLIEELKEEDRYFMEKRKDM